MNDQEQRIAIAEACGWRNILADWQGDGIPAGTNPKTGTSDWLPDYFNDLNAMHEAEKVFDNKIMAERALWLHHLGLVVGWANAQNLADARFERKYLTARATARQRAEGLLRTMELLQA